MLVTPLRDGMNLVAKEFVAARTDEDGVLVLSDFAGAASELAEAVHVNPYDVEGTAEAFYRALIMPEEERRSRMRALRHRVFSYDIERWGRAFLDRLTETPAEAQGPTVIPQLVAQARAASQLVLLLDYDGTLIPFARSPDLARPDAEALALLRGLAEPPGHRGPRGQRALALHAGALAGRAAHPPARRARAVVAGARGSRDRRSSCRR